jgi:cell division protein FtsL
LKTPYLLPRPPRNRYLVRERDRRRMHELARVAIAILVVGLALLGYTWVHLELLGSGYRVEGLEQRLHELERRQRHLRLEEAYLSNPQRVETHALKELGMKPPELGQLLFAGAATSAASALPPPAVAPPAPAPPATTVPAPASPGPTTTGAPPRGTTHEVDA